MDATVARAVFIGALLKTDPDSHIPDTRREDANLFVKTLLRAINICTRTDVKACKAFAVRFVLPSAARTAALTKYLVNVAKSCTPENSARDRSKATDEYEGLDGIVNGKVQQPPHCIFRRLHILYILHNLICFAHLKLKGDPRHTRAFKVDDNALQHLQATVPVLAQLAVCGDAKESYAAKEALEAAESMLASWEQHRVLPTTTTSDLHASLNEASSMSFTDLLASLAHDEAQSALAAQRAKDEASKWIIPKTHHLPHDPTAPWHELPAANGLFQKRTQGFPLRAAALPPGGFSLRNAGQKADDSTIKEVEDLLSEAKHCFDKYTDAKDVQDIDALGNIIWKTSTGRKRRNHWGWSYEGIERKRRLLNASNGDGAHGYR